MIGDLSAFLIAVLIGFALVSNQNIHWSRIQANSGYYVLLESAVKGGSLFLLFWLVLGVVKHLTNFCTFEQIFKSDECSVFYRYLPFPHVDALVSSGVVAIVTVLISNERNPRNLLMNKIALDSGLIPEFVMRAVRHVQLVQITTIDRVVYVGWLLIGPAITDRGEINDVAIFAIKVGYLDHETQEIRLSLDNRVRFRTYLLDQIDQGLLEFDEIDAALKELSVFIPMSRITNLCLYIDPSGNPDSPTK